MNKDQILYELSELFYQYRRLRSPLYFDDQGDFPFEEVFINLPESIYRHFGLKPSKMLDDILDEFLNQEEPTAESVERVIESLSQVAVQILSQPVLPHPKEWHQRQADTNEDNHIDPTDVVSEMRAYVMKNILIPLAEEEFTQIEQGFRLIWNAATGKMIGDGYIKRWVSQYLVSIEFQIDPRKVKKVVDLILEYMEEIGRWG